MQVSRVEYNEKSIDNFHIADHHNTYYYYEFLQRILTKQMRNEWQIQTLQHSRYDKQIPHQVPQFSVVNDRQKS